MLFVQLCLDRMFCQRIGGCDADDSFISIPLWFPSDIRIGLELVTWLPVSRLYFSLQEFSGPTAQILHSERRQMAVSIVGVGWIVLNNGTSRLAECHRIVTTFFWVTSCIIFLWEDTFLHSHCYPQHCFLLLMHEELCRLDGCISVVNEVPFPVS